MTDPVTMIDLSDNSFTADTENSYGYDFPIISGTKR